MLKLATYNVYEGGALPPFPSSLFYEYWLAGDGVYLRAKRTGLEILMPLSPCEIRGLPSLQPFVRLDYPTVPLELYNRILDLSRQAKDNTGQSLEKLFHLSFNEAAWQWQLDVPHQWQTVGSVKPVDSGAGSSYESAFIELHSHHAMAAFFSATDDRDEARSFRLFAVIGRIFKKVEIQVRVGVFGYFWQVDPASIFEMPAKPADRKGNEVETLNDWYGYYFKEN